LDIGGNVTLDVVDVIPGMGGIQVNSDDPCAACSHGGPTIQAENMNVVGDACFSSNTTYDGNLNSGADVAPDPLADLEAPWSPSDPGPDLGHVLVQNADYVTLEPGYYSGGIEMTAGTLTLLPGIYILDGIGMEVLGGDLFAFGVLLYIVDTTPADSPDSHIRLGGNGTIHITEPDLDGCIAGTAECWTDMAAMELYDGVSIWQDCDDTHTSTIIGTSGMDIEGTLYFPCNHVDLGGTGGQFGTQLIADTVAVSGNGTIHINYDGRHPAPGHEVFLVK